VTEERKKIEKKKARLKFTRDGVILTFAVCAATFEITLGGARPSVLTFLSGVFFSPLIMRFDERNKNSNGQ
jgi:hypothetical protein